MNPEPALTIFVTTLVPTLELRASIPYALITGQGFLGVLLAWATNIVLGFVLYPLLDFITKTFLHIAWIDRLYQRMIIRPRARIKKAVEKYGDWGLALFIAVPLPGSGVYTGAIGAYLLGIKTKDYYRAVLIGVTGAAVLVYLLVTLGLLLF